MLLMTKPLVPLEFSPDECILLSQLHSAYGLKMSEEMIQQQKPANINLYM